MHLVEADAADETPVAVHQVQVADLDPITVHGLAAARRTEQDIAVRQVDAFIVCTAGFVRQLPHRAAVDVHFVDVKVVSAVRLFPGEQNPPAVVRHVRVAEDSFPRLQQRLHAAVNAVQFQHIQRRAGPIGAVAVRERLGEHFRVFPAGPRMLVLVKYESPPACDQRFQTPGAASFTGLQVQLLPPRIAARRGSPHQGVPGLPDFVCGRIRQFLQHVRQHPLFRVRTVAADEAQQLRQYRIVVPGFGGFQVGLPPVVLLLLQRGGQRRLRVILPHPVELDRLT